MRTTFLKVTGILTLIAFCFSASIAQEWEVSDADKLQILGVVINKELERKRFNVSSPSLEKLLLSLDGIESLPLETIEAELHVAIINVSNPSESRELVWTSREYLAFRKITTDGARFTVALSRVKETPGGCFGPPPGRCEERVVYEMQRMENEWAVGVSKSRVNINLFHCGALNWPLVY